MHVPKDVPIMYVREDVPIQTAAFGTLTILSD